jgi:hypothetical protein
VNPNIPILGEPCRVYGGELSAVIVCNCRLDNPPMLLCSFRIVQACPHCLNVYRIMHMEYSAGENPRLAIGVVGKARIEQEPGSPLGDPPPPPKPS